MNLSVRAGLACGALTAPLLWLSFFPVNWGFCSWFALVPWLIALRRCEPRGARWASIVVGCGFYLPVLQWMRVADNTMIAAWLALSLICSVYLFLAGWIIRRIERRHQWPFVLTVPFAWTAVEFARSRLLTGFPWYLLGQAQHDCLPMIQVADLGGELAVSFVVVAVNAALADLFTSHGRRRLISPMVAAGLLAATVFYGSSRLNHAEFATGPKVALLQTNISQDMRNEAYERKTGDPAKVMMEQLSRLSGQAMPHRPDLIIWPETTVPGGLMQLAPGATAAALSASQRQWIDDAAAFAASVGRDTGIATLLGANIAEIAEDRADRRFNSTVLIDGGGAFRGRYDKIHCVPFGEYVPLKSYFPWLQKLTPYQDDYSLTPGVNLTRFVVMSGDREFHFGSLICYEDTDAQLARAYASDPSHAVDFLVNVSNDGWFNRTAEHEQHLAISRFRAVECRRSLVRAVNVGVSAIIDPNGRVTLLPGPDWNRSKGIEGVVVGDVPIASRVTFFARFGDWFAWSCAAMALILNLWPRRAR